MVIIYNNKSTIMPGSGVSVFCASFCELVTARKCQQASGGIQWTGSSVKIDELRDNALVQSARY